MTVLWYHAPMVRFALYALLFFGASLTLRLTTAGAPPPPSPATSSAEALPEAAPPLRYRIHGRVDPASGLIEGRLALRLRNTSRARLHALRMHLYLNAFASQQTRFMRSSGGVHRGHRAGRKGWVRIEEAQLDGLPAKTTTLFDGTVAALALPKALAPGAEATLTMSFRSQLPELFARTGQAADLLMGAQWYPKLAFLRPDGSWHAPAFHANSEFFGEFASFDVSLELPQRFVVGATGERAPARDAGGTRRHRFHARWVHDFAFVAWPHFRVIQRQIDGVNVELLTVRGRDSERQLALISHGLASLRRQLIAYPYARLTVVDLPRHARPAAAMEYPTLFTTIIPAWSPRWLRRGDGTTLHELVHQIFYGVVATNEAQEPWLDEGLTTFFSDQQLEQRYSPGASLISFNGLQLGKDVKNRLLMLTAKVAPVARAAEAFASWERYAANVYGRTANLLTTLESLLGRRRLLAALRRYAQRGRFGHPEASALEKELLARSPAAKRADVAELLAGVLHRGSTLDVGLACREGAITLSSRGKLRLPLTIYWRDRAGKEHRISAEAKAGAFEAPNLREARLGPPGRLALDETPQDDGCHVDDVRWSVALRFLPSLRQLMALVGP